MSNSPIEVMKAIVENGGPKEMWVSQDGIAWDEATVVGFDLGWEDEPILVETKNELSKWYKFASLTDPNKNYAPIGPWVNDWAKFRAVDSNGKLYEYDRMPYVGIYGAWTYKKKCQLVSKGHDPTNWENSLEERKQQTRPMTPREFAKFVEDNRGKYLYHDVGWNREYWQSHIDVDTFTQVSSYVYARNTEGELIWMELPEVEG